MNSNSSNSNNSSAYPDFLDIFNSPIDPECIRESWIRVNARARHPDGLRLRENVVEVTLMDLLYKVHSLEGRLRDVEDRENLRQQDEDAERAGDSTGDC